MVSHWFCKFFLGSVIVLHNIVRFSDGFALGL